MAAVLRAWVRLASVINLGPWVGLRFLCQWAEPESNSQRGAIPAVTDKTSLKGHDMTAERDTPGADGADVFEQSLPVEELEDFEPAGNRDEASEADLIEQSIEVPVDEDERD